MSDLEDDYMCEEEEDYGLVSLSNRAFEIIFKIYGLIETYDFRRSIPRIAIRSRMSIWKTNTTILKHWKKTIRKPHWLRFRKC